LSGRNWLILLLLTVAAFAGLLVYGDLHEVSGLLVDSPALYAAFAAALGLAMINYALRYLRWLMYLRALGIRVPWTVSVSVFAAGLALSITPGKAGELLKSVWLSRRAGVPVSTSAPAVVMERLTDVLSVGLLGLMGIALLPTTVALVVAGILAAVMIVGVLAASRLGSIALRLPVLRRWQEPLAHSHEGLRKLMTPPMLASAVILGAMAWAAEGLALWIIVAGMGEQISALMAIPISAAAALVGAITALPGGLVGFEGSMVALLRQSGLEAPEAALATLLTRLATLWFAVLIGLLAWLWISRSEPAAVLPEASRELSPDNR
jgi:uncharacterized protein (TIRG00374 family)